MRGWFDAFRSNGGPTLYAYSNRTSVTGDVPTITITILFLTVFLAFVTIFPGVRKERFSTFCTVTLSLLTGIVICVNRLVHSSLGYFTWDYITPRTLKVARPTSNQRLQGTYQESRERRGYTVCNVGSSWHVADGVIRSSYRAFSAHKIDATLGVAIGLDHANVTLLVIPQHNRSLDINFNERFGWIKPGDMRQRYKEALVRGLPYPILTVAEYLAVDNEGFAWGRYYRSAGYYCSIFLWAAFASWLLMNVMLVNVPRYGAYTMTVTGILMSFASLIFYLLMPPKPLDMRFENVTLTFRLGWCFWLTLVVGGLVTVCGLIISMLDCIYPHKFSTILEVDFDTPYDRHIIIEDSHETRKRRFKIPRLEEPLNAGLNAGSRLLRRLSKRGGKEAAEEVVEPKADPGVDNHAFEMEPPKAPWSKYPNFMMRTDSKKSTKSVNFRSASQRSQQFLDIPQLPDYEEKVKPFQRSDSKQSSMSSISVASSPKSVNFEDPVLPGPSVNPGGTEVVEPVVVSILRQDSSQSVASSSSSIGIGMLSRNPSVRRVATEENEHQVVTRNNSGNIIVFHRTDSRGQLQRTSGEVVEIQTDDSTDVW
ncbi:Dual oxidase maturation factor 1 [Chionoecetes opilio]|uniref:Dual oxidase maturation factor 1 n=1 Tax=Chionoecetes opilio TaxID=41210 RepID=A0A8J4XZ66_CHIOP|nr:Dual oxidase maturation factor 1 [Chionoecetes opilio]